MCRCVCVRFTFSTPTYHTAVYKSCSIVWCGKVQTVVSLGNSLFPVHKTLIDFLNIGSCNHRFRYDVSFHYTLSLFVSSITDFSEFRKIIN